MTPDPVGWPDVPGYEILDRVAAGGLAEVFHARDLTLGREVAVKVPRPQLWGQESVRRRFLEAARITAAFSHPGVPPVHAVGELPDGRPFLVMQLIRGRTLVRQLQADPYDPGQLLRAFESVCRTAGYAHGQGAVHRNLKARAVLLAETGGVFVISWGLVVRPEPLTQEVLQRYPQEEGVVVGTPICLPPEQARGEPADARSDVFGLGGILCHLLTGDPPFRGDRTLGVIQQAVAGDLRDAYARLDACGADPRLTELCKRCLAPVAADRPADGTAVADLVAPLLVS